MSLIGLILALFQMSSAFPQEPITPLDFTELQLVDMKPPDYPSRELQRNAEAWVIITTMVDIEGKPYETLVMDSSAQEGRSKVNFERAALRAMRDSTFIPAQLNGNPTESATSVLYSFQLKSTRAWLSRFFRNIQENFEEALSENNQENAAAAIARIDNLRALNRTEYALSQMNKFQYSLAFDDDIDARASHLENALRIENDNPQREVKDQSPTLPEDAVEYLRLSLLATQIERLHYAEAGEIAQILRKSGTDMTPYEDTLKQVNEIKSDESQYSIFGKTSDFGNWSIDLYKNRFFIANLGTLLQEIKLYCDAKYQYFTFTEGTSYTIPDSWGKCGLVITGEGNAEFELIQYRG